MSDLAWIDAALSSARPQAVAALLRYFRDLDVAEEAFQDACLRALKNWPVNGPPRDPGRLAHYGRPQRRHRRGAAARPSSSRCRRGACLDLEDAEADLVERLDGSDYRDDVLAPPVHLLPSDLPATQQIALALRIVSGLSVKQIARAFLVGESAMEQRITRAKAKVARADVPFGAPGAAERAERLGVVAAMVYLVFNEDIRPPAGTRPMRAPLGR
jgi:RNA polymerase sigma-70 factor (ECF subfamily)